MINNSFENDDEDESHQNSNNSDENNYFEKTCPWNLSNTAMELLNDAISRRMRKKITLGQTALIWIYNIFLNNFLQHFISYFKS